MSLVTWHTANHLDKFFDTDPFFVTKNNQWLTDGKTILPKVNVTENDNSFHLEAETPGMMEKDITVEVHNGVLTIKGRKENHDETKSENYHIREFINQGFERNFKLSERVNTEKVSAKIENGVLEVDMPIHEQVKPHKIEVTGVS
tara:strand:- start:366 stop:800 length:435 start_codon:yes stop_codon:yes gene_type:complete